jgi:uncharacterized protein YqgC (DUF456 family)
MEQPHIIIALLVVGSMLLAISTAAIFVPRTQGALIAFAAMIVCNCSHAVTFATETFLFWGVATAISVALDFMLPPTVSKSRAGVPFISGGALVGMVVGMLTNSMAGIIVCSAIGSFLGAMAYANSQAGYAMQFPSSKFFNYLAAKGLPSIVAMSMVGAVFIQIIS